MSNLSDSLNKSSFQQEIPQQKVQISTLLIISMILIGLSSNKDYVLSENSTVFYSCMIDYIGRDLFFESIFYNYILLQIYQISQHFFAILTILFYMFKLINVSTYSKKLFFIYFFSFVAFLITILIARFLQYPELAMFYIILISIMIIGGLSQLGECIFLGFLKDFDQKNVASWGAGTGLGNLIGRILIYQRMPLYKEDYPLGYNEYNIQNYFPIDICTAIVFQIIYFAFFFIVNKQKLKIRQPQLRNIIFSASEQQKILSEIKYLIVNQGIVNVLSYFAIYIVQFDRQFYLLIYEIFDFLGRSSLFIFKSKQNFLISFIQFAFFVIALIVVLTGEFINFISIIFGFLGFFGGIQYININNQLLENNKISIDRKDLAISILTLFNQCFYFLASLLTIFGAYISYDR